MEIQYVIINFLILAAILVFAGRKTVKRIFGDRREKIIKELSEAEEILERPLRSLPSLFLKQKAICRRKFFRKRLLPIKSFRLFIPLKKEKKEKYTVL